jgi:TPR repeat protein
MRAFPKDPVVLAATARALYKLERYTESAQLMKQAATRGHPYGAYGMGVLYEEGWGVPHDLLLAVSWYRRSAEQGYSFAQQALGKMIELGQGAHANPEEAVGWYAKAAAQGNPLSEFDLGNAFAVGRGIASDQK